MGEWAGSLVMEKQFTEATGTERPGLPALQRSARSAPLARSPLVRGPRKRAVRHGGGQKPLCTVWFKIIPKTFKGNITPTKK